MSNISGVTPGLLQGISQQPEAVRLPTKLESSENFYPDISDGLIKRHPTRHVGQVFGSAYGNVTGHLLDRGEGQRYALILNSGSIYAYDVDGTVLHVENTASASYLTCALSPRESLRATSVQDYTIITNKEVTPALDAATTTARNATDIAFIWVRSGNYKQDYTISFQIGATPYSYTATTFSGTGTPGAAGTGTNIDIKTHAIAEDLVVQINTAAIGVTASRVGSVIKLIRSTSPATIDKLEVTDSVGETSLIKYQHQIAFGTELAPICQGGFKIKVSGDPETNADDYWIEFVADQGGTAFGEGDWVESIGYGEQYAFDATTMPHQLVRRIGTGATLGSGYTPGVGEVYFDFDVITWDDKAVGDSEVSPAPSFIGEPIRDVFFFRNRLGFLAGDKIILSGAGQYFGFWRTTVQDLLDDDTIDVGVQHTRVSILNYAIPHNEVLLLFSDRTQFVCTGNPTLTPRTISVTPVTEFENDTNLRPFANGRTVFFGYTQGDYSQIREMYRLTDGESWDADPVTAEVPKYLEGSITYIAGSTRSDTIVFQSSTDRRSLWVYKYFWQGNQKVQSAWQKYTFGNENAKVHWCGFIEENLYLLIEREEAAGASVNLEVMSITSGYRDTGLDYFIALDRRIIETDLSSALYSAADNETTLTLPYEVEPGVTVEVWTRDGGIPFEVTDGGVTTPDVVKVRGSLAGETYYIGMRYSACAQLTRPILRNASQSGGFSPLRTGRTQVKKARVSFDNSAHFYTKVTRDNGATRNTYYNGPYVSDPGLVTDTVILDSGYMDIPIRSKVERFSLQLCNDSPLPGNFVAVEWEMAYTAQSQRQ